MNTQTGPAGAAAAELAPAGPRVLILEDEAGLRSLVRCALATEGVPCDAAEGARHGLDPAAQAAHDPVLLDTDLPDPRGDEALRRLRADARVPYQKVIVVSGGCEPDELAGRLSAGADDFLIKPFPKGTTFTTELPLAPAAGA